MARQRPACWPRWVKPSEGSNPFPLRHVLCMSLYYEVPLLAPCQNHNPHLGSITPAGLLQTTYRLTQPLLLRRGRTDLVSVSKE